MTPAHGETGNGANWHRDSSSGRNAGWSVDKVNGRDDVVWLGSETGTAAT